MTASLDGRIALVTGTSANIGGGIALALAEAGARVACVDAVADNARICRDAILDAGGEAIDLVCDVTDESAVSTTLNQVSGTWDSPDILVNNATRYDERGVLDMPVGDWQAQIDVLLTGSFLFTQQVARRLVDASRGGVILNLISTAGHQGQAGNIGYSTAKSGLLNFTRAAAMDLARFGIRVNSLTPTSTDPTEKHQRLARFGGPDVPEVEGDGLTSALRERRTRIPLGRLPRPSDYAAAAVFLCSDAASMITGTDLRVDGGVLARYWGWLDEPKAAATPG